MIDYKIIEQSQKLISNADAVIIGAGAGLSTAAGLHYTGQRFTDNFPDFIKQYGLTDMYSAMFYPFKTKEEQWAYQSRHTWLNSHGIPAFELYKDLLNVVKEKNYFVITTNGDAQFEKSGFDTEKIFATQGDYRYFQCGKGCHNTLYNNKTVIQEMKEQQKNFRVPTHLLPTCPVCGEEMVLHLRIDNYFVENEEWHRHQNLYVDFLKKFQDMKIVFLELGIGFNTPGIIRFPFEQFLSQNKNSHLIRVNMDNVQAYYNIPEDRAILLQDDISEFIKQIGEE